MSGTGGTEPGFDEELRAALVAFADGPAVPVVDAAAIERTVGRGRVRRGLLGGASVAGVAVLAVTGFFALRPGPAPLSPAAVPTGGVCVPAPTAAGSPEAGGSADPTPGAVARPDSGVVLPELQGLTLDQADGLLRGLGLRCTVVWHTDWRVPAGQVMGSDPRSDRGPVAPDSTVQLFVSRGKPGGQ
ncbi:PASTA domain-containing protein [Kitasatospora cineracea]|uniref:PASTA domain-containing protein n=1 Tax=Kitasatospora cineracea TaxID=88074 RepID=UPI0037FA9EEC